MSEEECVVYWLFDENCLIPEYERRKKDSNNEK